MNYVELHRFLCELGVDMGSKGALWFFDLVKMLHNGSGCASAVHQLSVDNGVYSRRNFYAIMKRSLKPVLDLSDEDLKGLGIVLDNKTSSALAVALEKFLD